MRALQVVLTVLLLLLSSTRGAQATTIDPATLEQLVLRADVVAVVECTVAGGGVAQYRVVERFSGRYQAGDLFMLRMAANYWEPQFPTALVGQRFLVMAHHGDAPANVTSHTMGGPVPLWWRRLPADVETPLFQGVYSVDGKDGDAFLARARPRIQQLLEAKDRELVMLQAVLRKELGMGLGMPLEKAPAAPRNAAHRRLWTRAHKATTVAQLLEATEKETRKEPRIMRVLLSNGGAQALAWLRARPGNRVHGDAVEPWVVEHLELVAGERKRTAEEPVPPPPPDAAAVAAARDAVSGNTPDAERHFHLVAREDPLLAAHWLQQRAAKDANWSDRHVGYHLASYLGWQCKRDCAAAMALLREAQDPYVRAAGAVYGCFHEAPRCLERLRALADLPGEPGQWVAVVRVTRGDKDAMPTALTVMDPPEGGGMVDVPRRNLGHRLEILLSNSAAAAKLPQPAPSRTSEAEVRNAYVAWWAKHGATLTLVDPWLQELDAQHVD